LLRLALIRPPHGRGKNPEGGQNCGLPGIVGTHEDVEWAQSQSESAKRLESIELNTYKVIEIGHVHFPSERREINAPRNSMVWHWWRQCVDGVIQLRWTPLQFGGSVNTAESVD
jgi:hypothetical protein